jgi:hypothetical protein
MVTSDRSLAARSPVNAETSPRNNTQVTAFRARWEVAATRVEASFASLEVARAELGSLYGSRPTQYLLGDFAVIADTLTDDDVVTLHRVVCCYPDATALLRGAAARTRGLLAFTYPRDCWYLRTLTALENFWRRLRGSAFRTFVHTPEHMLLRDEDFFEVPKRLRAALGKLIGAAPEDIILGNSTSYGLDLLANGTQWRRGDEALVVDGDFPADIFPWLILRN